MAFKKIGHFMEFYVSGKYIGNLNCFMLDRIEYGYSGAKDEIADSDIFLKNKKIKKVWTMPRTILTISQ